LQEIYNQKACFLVFTYLKFTWKLQRGASADCLASPSIPWLEVRSDTFKFRLTNAGSILQDSESNDIAAAQSNNWSWSYTEPLAFNAWRIRDSTDIAADTLAKHILPAYHYPSKSEIHTWLRLCCRSAQSMGFRHVHWPHNARSSTPWKFQAKEDTSRSHHRYASGHSDVCW